jgi:hypothetical protein
VGVAWIAEPAVFLDAARTAAVDGELQVTPGFAGLLAAGAPVHGAPVDWIDTGTSETYAEARRRFAEEPGGGRMPIDVTYLLADRVVKWFRDPAGADLRVARALDLGAAAPAIVSAPPGWLAYERVPGDTLRDRLDPDGVDALLDWTAATVWDDRSGGAEFEDAVRRFYGEKTLTRLAAYLAERGGAEPPSGLVINGITTPTVAEAVARELDGLVAAAVPSGFHGDLHEGNVIAGPDGYRLIDWRDDFGGLGDRGDRLYDLAKLLHTLELPESVMTAGTFATVEAGDGLLVRHPDTEQRQTARAAFWRWCADHGLDGHTLGIVDAIIFVNMAPLYEPALGDHLYRLGRWLLEVGRRSASDGGREATFTAALSGTRGPAG